MDGWLKSEVRQRRYSSLNYEDISGFDSPSCPPGTRLRRLRLILSLGRLVYQGDFTALAGGGYFKDWPESWLGPDGHHGLLLDGIDVDGVQLRHK